MMYIRRKNFFNSSILLKVCIAILWCFGIAFGSVCGVHSSTDYISVMRGFDIQSMSIVGRYVLLFLPLVFSVFAIHYGLYTLILPVVFCKAFIFSYSCCCIVSLFGSASWLLRFLLLFFDSCTLPFLMLIWLRGMTGKQFAMRYEVISCSIYMLIIACVDHYVVLPFTVALLTNL